MIYTVVWKPRQKRHLAELWLSAPDRAAVTSAADEIDRRLRKSPLDEGESREGSFRLLLVSPLGVKYRVLEEDRVVEIVRVWQTK
jgi:plasmid stabilization system protein ParE